MRTFLDRGEGKASVTKVQAIFVFEILKEKGSPVSKVWTIDMKNGQGSVLEGKVK
jgi:3-hydroxyacyl-CoA dehydrogenase/3a,7a,12a-trihydroxy-5b-cholest-24-enoyl-CoA hydratase